MTNLAGFEGKRNVDSGWKRLYPTQNVRFPNKSVPNLCHCEERSDVAIFKPKAWHPVARHGSRKRQNSQRPFRISLQSHIHLPDGQISHAQYLSLAQRANFTAQPCSAESRISLCSPNCALPRQAQRTVAAKSICGDRLVFLLNLLRPRASAPAGAYAAQRSRRPYGSPHDCPAAPCADSACRRSPRRRQRSHPHLGSSGRWRARRFR